MGEGSLIWEEEVNASSYKYRKPQALNGVKINRSTRASTRIEMEIKNLKCK
jgi:hypothetical protein